MNSGDRSGALARKEQRLDFVVLDGLRGIAAVVVVFGHTESMASILKPDAYFLAVDLFFIISGFVIGLAYEDRLKTSMSLSAFAKARLIRLYPMYLLGTVLYVLPSFLATHLFPSAPDLISASIPAAFMLPSRLPTFWWFIYPLNPVAWSLGAEPVANIVFALAIHRLTVRNLMIICALGALALGGCVHSFGAFDLGWGWQNGLGGLARVWFSFFAGVLIYKLRKEGFLPRWRVPWVLIACVVAATFWLPNAAAHPFVCLSVALVIYPVTIALAIGSSAGPRAAFCLSLAGFVSYPAYTLQGFIKESVVWLDQVFWWWIYERAPWSGLAATAVTVGLAYGAGKWIDLPVRSFLSRLAHAPAFALRKDAEASHGHPTV